MASITNMNLSIVRNVANADITLTFDIVWGLFDQATNLTYLETFTMKEDDTGQDGDNPPIGDDPVSVGLQPLVLVASGGQAVTSRTRTATIPFANLDGDVGDDEIRALITLTPQLPAAVSRESNAVTVVAP